MRTGAGASGWGPTETQQPHQQRLTQTLLFSKTKSTYTFQSTRSPPSLHSLPLSHHPTLPGPNLRALFSPRLPSIYLQSPPPPLVRPLIWTLESFTPVSDPRLTQPLLLLDPRHLGLTVLLDSRPCACCARKTTHTHTCTYFARSRLLAEFPQWNLICTQ